MDRDREVGSGGERAGEDRKQGGDGAGGNRYQRCAAAADAGSDESKRAGCRGFCAGFDYTFFWAFFYNFFYTPDGYIWLRG